MDKDNILILKQFLEAAGITIYKNEYDDEDIEEDQITYYYSISTNWGKFETDYHWMESDFATVDSFYKLFLEDK